MDLKISVLTVTLFFVKQYLALRAVAKKAYTSLRIHVLYDCNANVVYYDGMQLFKEEFGHSYVYDANGNITSVTDLQKKNTTYEYANNNLTKITLPSGASQTYSYDSYHNVLTATSPEGVVSGFTYDAYGNNTKVTVSGSGQTQTISATAAYTADGNQLASVTDALGKTTTYNYDPQTGVLNWVQEPDQTDSNRTNYTYDSRLRTTGVSQKNAQVRYTYSTNALLTSITSASGTAYNFAYGAFDQLSSVRIGQRTLVSHTYSSDGNRTLTRSTYGNGDSVSYTYDALGRATSKAYENGDTVGYRYDNSSNLGIMTDSATGRSTQYFYDFQNRLMRYEESGQGHSNTVQWGYDDENNLSTQTQTLNGNTYTTQYTYDRDNRLKKAASGVLADRYFYDSLGRMGVFINENDNDNVVTTYIGYQDVDSTATSSQVKTWTARPYGRNSYLFDATYSYDDRGNITSIQGSDAGSYTYDSFDRLISEEKDIYSTKWVYTYDDGGNILSKKEYASNAAADSEPRSTIEYTYGDSQWKDLLTAYNGTPITYDAIGNPLTDGTWTYTWQHGRQLAGMEKDGRSLSYTYNADGKRIAKTVDGVTYNYHYLGDRLVEMTWGDNRMRFTYDAIGPATVEYNGTIYTYVKNAQGDVVSIVNYDGIEVMAYIYDAWGNQLSTYGSMEPTLGRKNPLRYRGYVYDTETGLYYLNSRYYNPTWGRFINADTTDVLGVSLDKANWDKNLFAYCDNNPVIRTDDGGEFWHFIVGAVVGGLVNGISTAISGGSIKDVIISAAGGAISGALSASGIGVLGQVIGNAAISAVSNIATQVSEYHSGRRQTFSEKELIVDTVWGGVSGLISGSGVTKDFGQKHMVNLGKQTLSKTGNKLVKKGLSAYVKETGKQASFYYKSTIQITKSMFNIKNALLFSSTIARGFFSR